MRSLVIAGMLMHVSVLSGFSQTGEIKLHDPSTIVKEKSTYWNFSTGHGVQIKSSADLNTWVNSGQVFDKGQWPEWINTYVPDFKGHFWAPECIYMTGKYYLYYSCSTFGSSTSAIGVAMNTTLDQSSSEYKWVDLGMVVHSSDRSQINAIDPAMFLDSDGRAYLTYGSFSNGIGVTEIDPSTGKPVAGTSVRKVAGGNFDDWEAPYLTRNGSSYYLLANRGFCCRKTESTYRIVAGRSQSPTGPFVDVCGVDLNNGGGTELLGSEGKFIGPGHVGIFHAGDSDVVSIHYYDREDEGKSKLNFVQLNFLAGWPQLTREPLNKLSESDNNSDQAQVDYLTVIVGSKRGDAEYLRQKLKVVDLGMNAIFRVKKQDGRLTPATSSLKQNILRIEGAFQEGDYSLDIIGDEGVLSQFSFRISSMK